MATTLDNNGNVIVNGYSTNLSPTQFNTISASTLQSPQQAMVVPPAPQDTTDYNSTYTTPVTTSVINDYQSAKTASDNYFNAAQQAGQGQIDIMSALTGRTADLQNAQEQAGVNTETENLRKYTEQLANLNAQASSLNREAQAIPIQLQQESQGRGRTEAGVAPLQAARLRENALKALSIGQQADIAAAAATGSQLRLNAAKEKAQQVVDLKYKPLEDQLAIKKQTYELNKDLLASVDKKRAEALNVAIQKEQKDLEEKKANEKAVSDLIVNASSQNAPASILERAKKAKTPMEAAMALGQYAGDYWGTKIKIAQYNKIISETNKIDTQTSGLKLQPTGVVTTPNGDAVSLPNETLAAIGKLKLNEGQSNAVAFVSRMIQADAAIKRQLGEINPLGGFYETSGYDPTSFGSGVGRVVGSDQSRIYNTNAQDFIRAKLRKESGAAIGQDEFEADAKIYTPSGLGLDEKDLLLANTKREEAIKAMIAQAGPAAPYLQQYFQQVQTQKDTFMSDNPQLNTWYQNSSGAVTSTPTTATGFGFVDNQKQ